MKISDNALNILAAKTYKGVGRAWIVKNLKANDSKADIVALLNERAKELNPITNIDFENTRGSIKASILELAHCADGVVAIGDDEFPTYRGNVKPSEQPVALFYRGDLSLLNRNCNNIAVIGLLTPDKETEMVEQEMVSELVRCGATIVSGLAIGCDSIAHRQALLSSGKTIAILPSPLNEILPIENRQLADEIVKNNGLLITEYFNKANSKIEQSGRYQERDRLQALFSDCVILAASYAKNDMGLDSGSRLALEYASNYSIPRALLYDRDANDGNPKYDLNRQLIKEQAGITVINRRNMNDEVAKIVSSKTQHKTKPIMQVDMFG